MSILNATFETKASPTVSFFSQITHLLLPPATNTPITTAQIGAAIKLEKDQLVKTKLSSAGFLSLQYEAAATTAAKIKIGAAIDAKAVSGGSHKLFAGLGMFRLFYSGFLPFPTMGKVKQRVFHLIKYHA